MDIMANEEYKMEDETFIVFHWSTTLRFSYY
jgi:hypothetical protein